MNDIELQKEAREYARQVIYRVNFHVGDLRDQAFDLVMTTVHDQLVAAFVAGYHANTGPKEAA